VTYDVSFTQNGYEFDYEINAKSGKIITLTIMYDTVALCYREIGANVGGAWKAGKKFE